MSSFFAFWKTSCIGVRFHRIFDERSFILGTVMIVCWIFSASSWKFEGSLTSSMNLKWLESLLASQKQHIKTNQWTPDGSYTQIVQKWSTVTRLYLHKLSRCYFLSNIVSGMNVKLICYWDYRHQPTDGGCCKIPCKIAPTSVPVNDVQYLTQNWIAKLSDWREGLWLRVWYTVDWTFLCFVLCNICCSLTHVLIDQLGTCY